MISNMNKILEAQGRLHEAEEEAAEEQQQSDINANMKKLFEALFNYHEASYKSLTEMIKTLLDNQKQILKELEELKSTEEE